MNMNMGTGRLNNTNNMYNSTGAYLNNYDQQFNMHNSMGSISSPPAIEYEHNDNYSYNNDKMNTSFDNYYQNSHTNNIYNSYGNMQNSYNNYNTNYNPNYSSNKLYNNKPKNGYNNVNYSTL